MRTKNPFCKCGNPKQVGSYCRSCHNENNRRWIERNPEKRREIVARSEARPGYRERRRLAHYKHNYGMTEVPPETGVCGICQKTAALVIDHDHATGKLRGRLCDPCNRGLGFFGDCVDGLMRAVRYLEQS